ncbi:hypothetical protein JW859_03940 [bacterium]|nr:hypothetical protein [bacterium]
MARTDWRSGGAWLLVLLFLALFGCGGRTDRIDTTGADQPLLAQLPALPGGEVPREPTAAVAGSKKGYDYWKASTNVTKNGDELTLTAAPGATEYAVYQFATGRPGTATYNAGVDLSIALGNTAWVALSDYGAGYWAVYGPYNSSVQLPLDTGTYLSSTGDFYLAVLVEGGQTVTVNQATFSYDDGVVPGPTYLGDIQAILADNCTACHSGNTPPKGVSLEHYRGARDNSATVMTKAVDGSHGGLTQDEKDAFTAWVADQTPYGAAVTYTSDISPIIASRCAACHVSITSGGVSLDGYANAAANGENALAQILMNAMPQTGGPLSNEFKDLWQVWIDDGKPE